MALFKRKRKVDRDNVMVLTMLELICKKLGISEKEYMDKAKKTIEYIEKW